MIAAGTSIEQFDAIVVGGGPAGSATATVLAQVGWSVAVVESKRFPRRKVCGEYLSGTNWPLLEALGVAAEFRHQAGPEVRRVGLMFGSKVISAELPEFGAGGSIRWGRALGREQLDLLLLERARAQGACVLQPWRVVELSPRGAGFHCLIVCGETGRRREITAPIAVAAHGSWSPGQLPTQPVLRTKRGSDLFGFKATFHNAGLAEDLMPLLCFRDGYGGLVRQAGGRVSLSCCVRRDRLAAIERRGRTVGLAVLDYLCSQCPTLAELLGNAECDQPWLSAGPIRPGIRRRYREGVFLVGNAAGEAHPAVAEGVSMAMQAGWMLGSSLAAARKNGRLMAQRDQIGKEYAVAWRRAFAPRIHAAAAIAHWAMHPGAVTASLPLIRRFPRILTWGAVCSGKAAGSRDFSKQAVHTATSCSY